MSSVFILLNLSRETEEQIRDYAPAFPLHIIHCNIEEMRRRTQIEQEMLKNISAASLKVNTSIIDYVVLPQNAETAYWAAYLLGEHFCKRGTLIPLVVDVSDPL